MEENVREVKSILAVGGLDPTSGAGVLMDMGAASAVRCHTVVAVTTLTVQDGKRFISSNPLDPAQIAETLDALLGSVSIGAVKTGALCNGAIARVLADRTQEPSFPPLVIDPVMESTTGGVLLEKDGVNVLVERLLKVATLVTPNLKEAGLLTGMSVQTVDDMEVVAKRVLEMGAGAVLVKGGHLTSDRVSDVYLDKSGNHRVFENTREGSVEVRGTGCALASMIAAFISKGCDLIESITKARKILIRAIRSSQQIAPGPRILNFD